MYKRRYKGSKQLVALKEVQSKEKHYVNALFFELFFCVNLLSCMINTGVYRSMSRSDLKGRSTPTADQAAGRSCVETLNRDR